MSRLRTKTSSVPISGSRLTYFNGNLVGEVYQNHDYETLKWSCLDAVSVTHPYPDHDLDLTKGEMAPVFLNGTGIWGNPSWTVVYQDYRAPMFGASNCSLVPSSLMSWDELKAQALANANPNAPIVDIPLFLFELKDIPSMIRQAGLVLSRRAGRKDLPGLYLGVEFGWRPLLSDLLTLTKLGQAIDERLRYIDNLSGKGNRFARRLRTNQAQASDTVQNEPVGTLTISHKSKTTAWYTLSVKADATYRPDNPKWEAIRSSLGLRLSGETLWNMLPWSWMVDWFGNVGTVLRANRTGIPFKPDRLCVMQRTEFTHVLTADLNGTVQASDPNMLGVAKRRRVWTNPVPTVRFRLPVFTPRQIGILTALGLQFSFSRKLL